MLVKKLRPRGWTTDEGHEVLCRITKRSGGTGPRELCLSQLGRERVCLHANEAITVAADKGSRPSRTGKRVDDEPVRRDRSSFHGGLEHSRSKRGWMPGHALNGCARGRDAECCSPRVLFELIDRVVLPSERHSTSSRSLFRRTLPGSFRSCRLDRTVADAVEVPNEAVDQDSPRPARPMSLSPRPHIIDLPENRD